MRKHLSRHLKFCFRFSDRKSNIISIGVSPSGKATDSDSVTREFKSLYPSQTKRTGFCLFFCFTCEAVKERFELRATPSGGITVLRTVFSDDRRYLQSIGLTFRICFANIKRKISLPQPRENNTNTVNSAFVFFFYRLFRHKN